MISMETTASQIRTQILAEPFDGCREYEDAELPEFWRCNDNWSLIRSGFLSYDEVLKQQAAIEHQP